MNVDSCVTYPYTESYFFPRDYLWMFPATLVVVPFLLLVSCIHYSGGQQSKPCTLVAVVLAGIAAALLSLDYFIQLSVIQPSVLRDEADGLSLWSQYNAAWAVLALEALGYLMLSGDIDLHRVSVEGKEWLEPVTPLAVASGAFLAPCWHCSDWSQHTFRISN